MLPALPRIVLKATASGFVYARPVGTGSGSVSVALTVGDDVTADDPPALTCSDSDCYFATRSFGGSATSVLVPAGAYVEMDAT